ncbi:MAG: Gfo/Idh/MocA family oxidoreductase [Planctomycetes bacterium]|nr:Gfo/Idh/MocA family oxidoreductase [Planctomycetota bacterium]
MDQRTSRRGFLGRAAGAAAALSFVPRHILGGTGFAAPSERLNLALIGAGGRGKNLVQEAVRFVDAQIIAVADPTEQADYSKFYYQGVSGRGPVLKLVKNEYGGRPAAEGWPAPKGYVDFRKMLDEEKAIDAVMIATPDHAHAVTAIAAMKLGKHVYCEKPLTRTVYECRRVVEVAREAKVATQMGNQGHSGEGIRLVCEWIWSGTIGPVREVHSWSDTGRWAYPLEGRPSEAQPVPKGTDWDMWIGPVPFRPYNIAYAPYNWRGWWQFGTSAIGDMGCHNLDPGFLALKLGYPATVEGSCTGLNGETVPHGSIVRYEFPARGDMPPVKVTWYDGGLRPPRPAELEPGRDLDGNGIILIGDKGTILCGGWSNGPRLLPESRMKETPPPPRMLPRVSGWMRDWIDAAKGGNPSSSNFDVAGPMVEAILLGNVAVRTGKKLEWDGANLKAKNAPEADRFIRPEYRAGWTI